MLDILTSNIALLFISRPNSAFNRVTHIHILDWLFPDAIYLYQDH